MSTITNRPSDESGTSEVNGIIYRDKPEGPIAAAILASGVGALTLGVVTTLAEVSKGFRDTLNVNSAVGPLSGKTIVTVVVWLVAWAVLHLVYRFKPYERRRVLIVAFGLIALGVLGTFPTFFQAFGD